jgi:PPOX class probable FMN-dependent enzyme
VTADTGRIETVAHLLSLYGTPGPAAIRKVARRMTPLYRKWIAASRFCVLSTVGADGTDGSPRGDDGPVVLELDPGTLAMPDWRGNNRLDSLRNIVEDGRISLMFFVPGSNNVVRLNGTAWLTTNDEMRARFAKGARWPDTVIMIEIGEIYTQCARALMRATLWSGTDQGAALPSVGDILAEMTDGEEGGARYDEAWHARAAKTMW